MLKSILRNRLFIGIWVLLVCGVVSVYFLRTDLPDEPVKIYTPVEIEPPTAQAPIAETPQGHFHEDGTFHADPPAPVVSPSVSDAQAVSASSVRIPDGITDPDVMEAWQHLDDIAKNPFQWGGRPSDRALELMDELTPMWVSDDPHDHGEELMMTLDLLAAERDPRSAALLLTYQLDSEVQGRPINEALVAMGPASVSALIARLNPSESREVSMVLIIHSVVVPIVEQHREALGGILDYILIPRLEAIAALEDPTGPGYIRDNRSFARKALALLRE